MSPDHLPAGALALLTGASSGIGQALASLFAADGCNLALVARRGEALERLAGELGTRHRLQVHAYPAALARPRAAAALWARVERDGLAPTALVNNAGVGMSGPPAEHLPEALERMLELRITTRTGLTRLALPGLIARGKGHILNVSSLAGYQPGGPRMAAYYASKAYVLAFPRGLARELRGSGVFVTALCPGPTATGFDAEAGDPNTALFRRGVRYSAQAVARAGYGGMRRGRATVVPGLVAKLLAVGGELPPRWNALEINQRLPAPLPEIGAENAHARSRPG